MSWAEENGIDIYEGKPDMSDWDDDDFHYLGLEVVVVRCVICDKPINEQDMSVHANCKKRANIQLPDVFKLGRGF